MTFYLGLKIRHLLALGEGAQVNVLYVGLDLLKVQTRGLGAQKPEEKPLKHHPSLTMTQPGSVFRDAAETRHCSQALRTLALTQSQWCPKGHFSVHLAKIFISKKGLAPSGGPSRRPHAPLPHPFTGLCCTIGFPSRGQVLSLSCHSLAQQREISPSLGPQDSAGKSRWWLLD